MRHLAVIPARKGSKRIPGKNIKILHGKPLVAYSIEQALNCKSINDIVISTDIEQMESIVQSYSDLRLKVFWRDEALAGDLISTEDVLVDVLGKLQGGESISSVVTLLPTSPFRSKKMLQLGYDMFKKNKFIYSVISVSKSSNQYKKKFEIKKKN